MFEGYDIFGLIKECYGDGERALTLAALIRT